MSCEISYNLEIGMGYFYPKMTIYYKHYYYSLFNDKEQAVSTILLCRGV